MNPENQVPQTPSPDPQPANVTPPPQAPQSLQPIQSPLTQQPFSASPMGPQENEDAKIKQPKYWLTVLAILAAFITVHALADVAKLPALKLLTTLIWIVALVVCVKHVGKLKQAASDTLSKKDKYKSVVLMALDPLVGQAIYYFMLKKIQPENAKKFNKIGWKVFAIQVSLGVVGLLLLMFFLGASALQVRSWYSSNGDNFVATSTAIRGDISAISNAVQSENISGVISACQKLSKDTATLKAIPTYPVEEVRTTLSGAINELDKAAQDCQDGINNQDSTAFTNSALGAKSGMDKLKVAYDAIQERNKD